MNLQSDMTPKLTSISFFCIAMTVTLSTFAQEDEALEVDEMIVWGRAETQKGKVRSVPQGLVGYADFSTYPLQRVGELTEVVPGMVAMQHDV
jgi:hypothetical protein